MKTYLLDETLADGTRVQWTVQAQDGDDFQAQRAAFHASLLAMTPSAGGLWPTPDQLPIKSFEERADTPSPATLDAPKKGDKGRGDK